MFTPHTHVAARRLWLRELRTTSDGKAKQASKIIVRGHSKERHSAACDTELVLNLEADALARRSSIFMSTAGSTGEDALSSWLAALEPQVAASRAHLTGRAWQQLTERTLCDDWTLLLRRADAVPRVTYVSEFEEHKGEPGGFLQALTLEQLPGYFKKLVGPYELRVYWFEVFECIRKVALIGLPVRPARVEPATSRRRCLPNARGSGA